MVSAHMYSPKTPWRDMWRMAVYTQRESWLRLTECPNGEKGMFHVTYWVLFDVLNRKQYIKSYYFDIRNRHFKFNLYSFANVFFELYSDLKDSDAT